MKAPKRVGASDLFVLLEKAYRRSTPGCTNCVFSIPFRIFRSEAGREGAWSVIPAGECSHDCRAVLDDVVARFQKSYRLDDDEGLQAR